MKSQYSKKTKAVVVAADLLSEEERKALTIGWRYSPFDRPVANYFLVCRSPKFGISLYPIRLDHFKGDDGLDQTSLFIGPAPGRDGLAMPYTCAKALVKWCRTIWMKNRRPIFMWGMVHTPQQYDYIHALTGGIYPNFYMPAPRSLMPTLIELGRRHFPDRFQGLNVTVEPVYPRVYTEPRTAKNHFFAQRNPHYLRGDGLLVAFRMGPLAAMRLLSRTAWAQYRPQKFLRKAMEKAASWRGNVATQKA